MKKSFRTKEPSCFKCSFCQLVAIGSKDHQMYVCQNKDVVKQLPKIDDRFIESDMVPLKECVKSVV